MARLLTTPAPELVGSFRDHFYKVKPVFFTVFIVFCVSGLMYGWIVGSRLWGSFAVPQYGSLAGIATGIAGLTVRNDAFHHVLATFAALVLVGLVMAIPAYE